MRQKRIKYKKLNSKYLEGCLPIGSLIYRIIANPCPAKEHDWLFF